MLWRMLLTLVFKVVYSFGLVELACPCTHFCLFDAEKVDDCHVAHLSVNLFGIVLISDYL